MEELTKKNFDSYMKEDLVFVDFWATWCGPCRSFSPIFEATAEKYDGRAKFLKCNVDDQRDLALKQGIMSIPCVIAFKAGKPAAKQVGLVSEEAFSRFIEQQF